jgi:Leucine-rich repeat (LRR) protein
VTLTSLPEGISALTCSLQTLDLSWVCEPDLAAGGHLSVDRPSDAGSQWVCEADLAAGGHLSVDRPSDAAGIYLISALTGLQTLYLSVCVRLTSLPEGISALTGLQTLDLRGCKLEILPRGIHKCGLLRRPFRLRA